MAKGIGSGLNPFLWLKGFDWVKVQAWKYGIE